MDGETQLLRVLFHVFLSKAACFLPRNLRVSPRLIEMRKILSCLLRFEHRAHEGGVDFAEVESDG